MTSLTTLSPFNRLFNQLESSLETSCSLLTSEINENEQAYTVSLVLPGFKKDEVVVEVVEGDTLRVSASKKGSSARRAVSKSFQLDSNHIDTKGITAKLEDGILNIVIPKVPASKPRQIIVA